MDQQVKYMSPVKAGEAVRFWGMTLEATEPDGATVWVARNRGGFDITVRISTISPTRAKMVISKTKCIC